LLLGRRHRCAAAWAALFAIWLQIAVVFPHICPDEMAGRIGHPGLAPALSAAVRDEPELPFCPLSEGRGGNCAIYAAGHLGGASLLPDAIKLAPRRGAAPGLGSREAALQLSRAAHLLFQTRAPPVA
jgi:hypothetical protein